MAYVLWRLRILSVTNLLVRKVNELNVLDDAKNPLVTIHVFLKTYLETLIVFCTDESHEHQWGDEKY